jgi:hypothetical protein
MVTTYLEAMKHPDLSEFTSYDCMKSEYTKETEVSV